MPFTELPSLRTRQARVYQDSDNPNRRHISTGLVALHYESTLDSGAYDTPVDFTPVRITNAQLDGWQVTSSGWHYALGQPAGKADGWVGFGGRRAEHWFQFRLLRLGYLHWPTRAWQDVSGAPTYTRTGGRLTQTAETVAVGPNAEPVVIANIATWTSIWTTPGGGRVDLNWRLSGDGLKEEVIVNQAARTWVATNRPPTTPTNETWFGLVFHLDLSDLPHFHRAGIDISPSILLDITDDGEVIAGHDVLDRLLFLLPVSDLIVRDPTTGEEVARTPLRKRIYYDAGEYYLLVGARADVVNGLPAGNLAFDPTLNLTIAASADDAHEAPAGTVTITGTTCNLDAAGWWNGYRFLNVTINQGDTIDSAYWRGRVNGTAVDDPDLVAYCEDVDDSAAFTTTTNDIENRVRTTASTAGSGTSVGAVYWPASPGLNITTAVQEVINRAGWVSGNDLSVILEGVNVCNVRFRALDGGTGTYATLDITYTAAGGGATYNLVATLTAATATPGTVLAVQRDMSAALTGVTDTPTPVFAVDRAMSVTLTGATDTSNVSLAILREMAATLTGSTDTSASTLAILRAVTATLTGVTNTSDTAVLSVLRAMQAVLTGATDTAAIELSLQGIIELAATLTAMTNTNTPVLAVQRDMAATLTGITDTRVAALSILYQLAATLTAVTDTSPIDLSVLRSMSATLTGATDTSAPVLSVLRAMQATLTGVTNTSAPGMGFLFALAAILTAATATSGIDVDIDLVTPTGMVIATFSVKKPGVTITVKAPGVSFE